MPTAMAKGEAKLISRDGKGIEFIAQLQLSKRATTYYSGKFSKPDGILSYIERSVNI